MAEWGELERAFKQRVPRYGSAVLRVVVTRRKGKVGDALRGRLTFRPSGRDDEEFERVYDGVRQIQQTDDPEAGLALVEALLDDGEAPFADPPPEPDTSLEGPDTYHGNDWPKPIGRASRGEWPSIKFRVTGFDDPNYPTGPLLQPGLPPLTDPRDELENWLGLQRSDLRNGGLEVVLPDYRARVASVRFREDDVVIRPETNVETDDLYLRAAVSSRDEGSTELGVERRDGTFVAHTGGLPSTFYAFLLDTDDQVIDWCRINTNSDRDLPQVEFSQPEQKLRQTIAEGEGKSVEFKEYFGDGARIAESVIAFANEEGGEILVGVDDNGKVTGIRDPSDIRERILNELDPKCEPSVDVRFNSVTLDGNDVLVVSVPEGSNPPYVHRQKGVVFVRRGSTDRRAGRSDIDDLYDVGMQGPGPAIQR